MIDPAEVTSRVNEIRAEISSCGGRDVSLIAVTKTFPTEAMSAAAQAGCDGVGENYAQELAEKASVGLPPIPVHFIGGIQSNKVKIIAPFVDLWQSVDRESVIEEIARRSPGASVLLQVNTTGEGSKGGLSPSEVESMCTRTVEAGLRLDGLMTIGPTGGTTAEQESAFRLLRRLVNESGLSVCSMGMSDDFHVAVACGSTMVRIGSRLFGARPAKN